MRGGEGLGFKTWISQVLGGNKTTEEVNIEQFFDLSSDIYVRELAFWSCVNLISNAISKCEFKTFVKGEETKGAEYYLWNVEPNKNQSSSVFLHKMLAKLFRDNEVLVIEEQGQLLVADSFCRKPYALYEDLFSQIQVGDYGFNKTYSQGDVLYFTLGSQDMKQIIDGLYQSYSKLLAYGIKSYEKSRGNRGVLSINAIAHGKSNFNETFSSLMNERFRTFFSAESAVLPLFDGYTYEDLGSKTYSNEGTRDIRAMIDDISDFTAKGFGIPPALLRGDVEGIGEAQEGLLTFCVDPLCDKLQEEINRKRSKQKGYLEGTYLQIDTKCIKHVDLLSVSTAIDKLIASGAFTINDIRKLVGEQPIKADYANEHFMTKNYAAAADLLTDLSKGGDK